MTNVNYSGEQPQLMQSRWNKRAIISFIVPFVIWGLAAIIGLFLPGLRLNMDNTISMASYNTYLPGHAILVALEFIAYVALIAFAHASIRQRYRNLRGRGFGIAALVLGYLGAVFTIIGFIGLFFLPELFNTLAHISG